MTEVLYIAGWQRSGTTLLGDILGSFRDACHVGELTYLSTPTHPADGLCGCGSRIESCPLWSRVLESSDLTDARHLANRARLDSSRMRHVPGSILSWKMKGKRPEYTAYLERIYKSIADISGSSVIVDSSKSPGEAMAAVAASGLESKILHIVRDPRGCAYSLSRRAKLHHADSNGQMRLMTPRQSSFRWAQVNGLVEGIKMATPVEQSLMVRYEDLMANPRQVVDSIASWAGLTASYTPFTTMSRVHLAQSHTVMGNPNRFSSRTVSLTSDEEWRRSMTASDTWSATVPALPLLAKYGYPLRPGADARLD